MSIDHGKLLERLTLVAQAIKPIKGLQGMDETINEAIRALAQPAEAVQCIWPDCGHDTNQSDPSPGCNGKFCPKPAEAAEDITDLVMQPGAACPTCKQFLHVQPAEAVEGADAFDHDAALAEWRRLEGHQPDAVRMRAAISASIPASINEAAQDADDYWRDMYRIERAMRFMDGGMSREGAFTAVDKEMAHGGARGARRDAAQGAVAWGASAETMRRVSAALCVLGHSSPESDEELCAAQDKWIAALSDEVLRRYATHPQAAPAQAWIDRHEFDYLREHGIPVDVTLWPAHQDDDDGGKRDQVPVYARPIAPAQGDGWKLVPVHPTAEMLRVAIGTMNYSQSYETAEDCYRAMLAAAPSPEPRS